MSATLGACRAPVAAASRAGTTSRQQQRVSAALQPLRPCSTGACFRRVVAPQQGRRQGAALVVRADGNTGGGGGEFKKNTQFGYSRKDVIIIGMGLFGGGYVLYYGLQATGMEPGIAGNWVQLIIFMGICVGWVGSYIYRVATKQMTYAQQLDDYEEAVMRKRLEEMPEQEVERMLDEVEGDKEKRRIAREQRQQQQEQQK